MGSGLRLAVSLWARQGGGRGLGWTLHLKTTSLVYTHSKEICEANDIFMCPLVDHSPKYQRLSEMCAFAKV